MGDREGICAEIPREFGKNLRACWGCHLVKTADQFAHSGCDNCDFLEMADREQVSENTSPNFHGLTAIMEPNSSWAAKWQHLTKKAPGVYALSIQGKMPLHVEDALKEARVAPVPQL
mmetsp:Transcript_15565/g.46980  ORF Transcript_15565/g.46980 Transcript_15565/m.46980 type:complete len:117 (-) Transcript_15565:5235-5585(-)